MAVVVPILMKAPAVESRPGCGSLTEAGCAQAEESRHGCGGSPTEAGKSPSVGTKGGPKVGPKSGPNCRPRVRARSGGGVGESREDGGSAWTTEQE